MTRPTAEQIDNIDLTWPPRRRATDWHHAWRWVELTRERTEVFGAVANDGEVLGIWCSAKHKPVLLPEGAFYRLDYVEVAPGARGQEMGVFTFLLVAARALELGAGGIVLATWEPLTNFYTGLGGVVRKPAGWNAPSNLVPFTFDVDVLDGLKEALARMEDHG